MFTHPFSTNILRAHSPFFTIVTGERQISHMIAANWWFAAQSFGSSSSSVCNFRRGGRTRGREKIAEFESTASVSRKQECQSVNVEQKEPCRVARCRYCNSALVPLLLAARVVPEAADMRAVSSSRNSEERSDYKKKSCKARNKHCFSSELHKRATEVEQTHKNSLPDPDTRTGHMSAQKDSRSVLVITSGLGGGG